MRASSTSSLPACPSKDPGDRQASAEAIGASCELFVTSDTDFSALFSLRIKGVLVEKRGKYARDVLLGETPKA